MSFYSLENIETVWFLDICTSTKRRRKNLEEWEVGEGVGLTIQNETPACSGHPDLSAPSSSCRRWDSPDCRRAERRLYFSSQSFTYDNTDIVNVCWACTWYRAHPRGGIPDSADTESTGERNAPPGRSGERSENQVRNVRVSWMWHKKGAFTRIHAGFTKSN